MGIQHLFWWPTQCFIISVCQWPDTFKVSQLEKWLWIKQMKPSLTETPDGACSGVFPSICLLPLWAHPLLPKDVVPIMSLALTGSSGTGHPRLPHYLRQSVLHPRLQSIIIQMSQPQWEGKNMQADFSPAALSQYSLITASSWLGQLHLEGWREAAVVPSSKQNTNNAHTC